jgi:hypothetical protein
LVPLAIAAWLSFTGDFSGPEHWVLVFLGILGRRLLDVCVKFSEDEVASGVHSTSADTLSDQPLSEWPAGREADRTSAQRTATVGLTDRGSLIEFALMADCPLRLPVTMVGTSAV